MFAHKDIWTLQSLLIWADFDTFSSLIFEYSVTLAEIKLQRQIQQSRLALDIVVMVCC